MWAGCGSCGRVLSSLSLAIQCIRDLEARLAEPLLVLTWQSTIPEVDTWVVEWFPETVPSEFSGLSWEAVSRVTHWTVERGSRPRTRKLPWCRVWFPFKQLLKPFVRAALEKFSNCHSAQRSPAKLAEKACPQVGSAHNLSLSY